MSPIFFLTDNKLCTQLLVHAFCGEHFGIEGIAFKLYKTAEKCRTVAVELRHIEVYYLCREIFIPYISHAYSNLGFPAVEEWQHNLHLRKHLALMVECHRFFFQKQELYIVIVYGRIGDYKLELNRYYGKVVYAGGELCVIVHFTKMAVKHKLF